MMCAASATVLTLLLNCLMLSEGTLSPPLNVSVEVLDLQTLVRWLPRPGHPTGTRYDLEFTDINHFSKKEWNQTTACTNITSTQCYLMLNEFFTNYYVRVMAKWREERSNWTRIGHSFQPYSYNKLSPPELNVFTKQHSICVNFSHALLHSKHGILKFSVDLYEVASPNKTLNHIKLNTSNRSHCFEQLPPGNYCITASAYLTLGQKDNYNSTKCVLLEQHQRSNATFVIQAFVIGGSVLLLTLLASIATFVWCNLRFKMNKSYIPRSLLISETSTNVLTLTPEEPQLYPLSAMDYYKLTQEELDDSASQDYNIDYVQRVEEPDQLWSSVVQMEKRDDYMSGDNLDCTDLDQNNQVSFFTITTMNTHQRVEEPDRTLCSSVAQIEKCDDYMRGEDLDFTNLDQTDQVSFFTITTMNSHQRLDEPDQTWSPAAQIQKHDDYMRGEDLDCTDLDQTKQVSFFTITTMNTNQRVEEPAPTLCSSVAQMEKCDDYMKGEDLDCTDFDQNDQVSFFTIMSMNTQTMFQPSYPGVKLQNRLCFQPELFHKDTPAMELHHTHSLSHLSDEAESENEMDSLNSDIYESNGYESRPAIF